MTATGALEKERHLIGIFHFKKGREGSVTIGTEGTEGKYVIVDAVQFLIVMP